jgi:ankyrin repeat protein
MCGLVIQILKDFSRNASPNWIESKDLPRKIHIWLILSRRLLLVELKGCELLTSFNYVLWVRKDLLTYLDRFLLAFLHIESLKTKNELRSLREALHSLPDQLDSAYDEVMERIEAQGSDDLELATKILYWINCAIRPLTLREAQTVLAIRPGDKYLDEDGFVDEERLLSVCAGMVTLQRESKTIILVHYTAEDYFKKQHSRYFPHAQTDITTICLTYISFDTFSHGPCGGDGELAERLKEHPFMEYAARYWGDHFSQDQTQGARDLVLNFLQDPPRVSCSIQIIQNSILKRPCERPLRHDRLKYSHQPMHDVHGLWIAAYFNLEDIIKIILENNENVLITKTGYGETALHAAARSPNSDVIERFLNAGADINILNEYGESSLLLAASNIPPGEVPGSGHSYVTELLIDRGADVKVKNNRGWTVLHETSSNGHETVVKLLLYKGADIAAKDNDGITALHVTSENGHEAVVKLLLDYGADIDAKDNGGLTPLHFAAGNGHEAVVELLLEIGADIAVDTNDGLTVLHFAAVGGHEVNC